MKDLSIKGQITGDSYDANKLSENGIWLITNMTIKNANNITWAFLISLKFDVNTTLQFLVQTDAEVTIFKRKLSPSEYTPNSEWMKIG